VLRVDHTISFLGLTILRLHYKMFPAVSSFNAARYDHALVPSGKAF